MFSCLRASSQSAKSRDSVHKKVPTKQHAPVEERTSREQASQTPWPEYQAGATGGSTTQPADASSHGALSYQDLNVLHFCQGERLDILFASTRFQGPSIAALLREVQGRPGMGSEGAGRSEKFLELLLGSERAQAAEMAVLNGQPFVTVIKKKLPVFEAPPSSTGSEGRTSPAESANKLAKLALQSDHGRSSNSTTRCMQVSLSRMTSTLKELPGTDREQQEWQQQQQQQQQQQHSMRKELRVAEDTLSKAGPSFQMDVLSESLMPLPPSSSPQQPAWSTLTAEDSTWLNRLQAIDQQSHENHSGSAIRLSTPSITHPLHPMWSAGTSLRPTAAHSSNSGPSAPNPVLPHILACSEQQQHSGPMPLLSTHCKGGQHSAGELHTFPSSSSPLAKTLPPSTSPFANTTLQKEARSDPQMSGVGMPLILETERGPGAPSAVECRRSKMLPILSAPTFDVFEPRGHKVPGEFDRTMALLQALQSDHSPCNSDKALPDLTATTNKPSVAGGASRKLARKTASSMNVLCHHHYDSPAVDFSDVGLHIRDLEEGLLQMSTRPSSSTAAAWGAKPPHTAAETGGSQPRMCEGTQGCCREESSEVKTCAFATCRSSTAPTDIRQDSQEECPMVDLEEQVFEVSIQSIPSVQSRWRKAVGMISFMDVTSQLQAQAALLSLAENQLSLLSSFLPKHAIEFLAKRGSNAESIPQNVGKLARSHKMATVLFMDICGFTSVSKAIEPHQVLEMLNTLFSLIDKLTDKYRVHKIETAGDCYIVSAGILSDQTSNGFQCTLDNNDHPEIFARRVMEFAKAALQETVKVKIPNSTEPVQMRVGIHSGDVVSGLIGSKLPKFSSFGDTMNTAARMESTGKPGRIHVSETTQGLLPEYAWEAMGKINVKGKGMMATYLWDARRGWNQQAMQQQQVAQRDRPGPEIQHPSSNNTRPLSLAINVLKGLTAMRSKTSHELGQA